jgi:hypothetical protein
MRALAIVLAVPLLFAAPAASTTRSGLAGVVRVPIAVCLQDDPCDGATAGVTLAFSRGGTIVKRVTSAERGRYRAALPPGTYSVTSADGLVRPARVRVYSGSFHRVDFLVGPKQPQ